MNSEFTFMCSRARVEANGAHDITDAMSTGDAGGRDDRVLYCRQCGQTVLVTDAIHATARALDRPMEPIVVGTTNG